MSDSRWTKTRLTSALVSDVVDGVERETLAKWVTELAAEVLKARTMLADSAIASVRRIESLEAEVERLREALAECLEYLEPSFFEEEALVAGVVKRARAALAGEGDEGD